MGDFEKKVSCKLLSEKKLRADECNRKLMGKKREKISRPPDCYKKNS